MTDQTCTATIDGGKCGAELRFVRVIRGGEVELYTCASHHAHKRHISRAGRQYTTHPEGPRKDKLDLRAYQWQIDEIAKTGRTPQEFWDVACRKLVIDMQAETSIISK